ncbi:purine phosphorylase [Nonomuraea sp. NPDC050383]|uniref:5'-methylthioadenosine/S-adenosylhomocysteine nucleosidase family protein n=1 Tax=Nonomuraea sp. NPDC050383 TaxID=3364362 RepID=UPI003796A5DA
MSPVVILTALDLEYQAIREKLAGLRLRRHPQGTLFEVGRLADGRCEVALAQVGKGNHAAAVLAERAIAEFRPAALLFVGVAGALQTHIALGDVVVATHVYAFHGGTSEDDGFKSRPRVWQTSHAAEQIAQHLHRGGSWAKGLDPRPNVHFGAIAAGEVVLNSRLSEHARWIRDHYNDARAIEMEGAGVAQAGHLNRALPVVVIRGISDRADGTKEATDRELWQPRAAANAATFAAALAEELCTDEPTTRSSAMSETVRNIAKGNAHVGVQAGIVHGGIRITPETSRPADLPEALAGFRTRLWQAWADGRLDEATYKAAETELVTADQALETKTPDRENTLTLALKKLRGLVGDVADLAAELTVIIALVQSLS